MPCVLRISAPSIAAALPNVALLAYRVERGTAHFSASEAAADDLAGQVHDAVSFLTDNREAIAALLALPQASGELDFATEYTPGAFTSRALPAAIVRLAGALGLGLTVSGYPSGNDWA
ncbi:MAG: hypothetical protein FWC42_09810 [Proteobacteria bacterium]|nr:hypothetical protein [Pseudomonadota bacterium]